MRYDSEFDEDFDELEEAERASRFVADSRCLMGKDLASLAAASKNALQLTSPARKLALTAEVQTGPGAQFGLLFHPPAYARPAAGEDVGGTPRGAARNFLLSAGTRTGSWPWRSIPTASASPQPAGTPW